MQCNNIENVNTLQVDNLYTATNCAGVGPINVHNDLNIFNSPPGGGHITFTAGIQIGNTATTAAGTNSLAIGNGAIAAATNAVAIGDLTSVSAAATNAIAVGTSAIASATAGVAVGASAIANVANGIAIGNATTTNSVTGTICLGTSAGTVNLAANHPLAIAVNAAGVNAAAGVASTHTLGIVINGVQYRMLLVSP